MLRSVHNRYSIWNDTSRKLHDISRQVRPNTMKNRWNGEIGATEARYLYGSTMRRPTRLAFGLTPIIEELETQGHAIEPLLKRTNIPRFALIEPSYRISFEQELMFIKGALKTLRGPALGIAVGCRYHLPLFGVLGLAAACAPTVREMFRTVPDFPALAWGSIELSAWREREYEYIAFHENEEVGKCAAFFVERDTAATLSLIRQTVGSEIVPSKVRFREEKPDNIDAYERFFRCPITFGDSVNQIWFERELWEARPPQSNAVSYRFFTNQCRQLSEVMHMPLRYADIVKARLRAESPIPQFENLIRSLSLSRRTLQRHLRQEHTNYSQILAEVRLERAQDMLKRQGINLEEIATCLGFREASVFSRAFKKWTGLSPHAYREENKPSV